MARKAKIVKKREVNEEDNSPDITQTPKFKLLELVRELDEGEGITPEELVTKAEASGISRPQSANEQDDKARNIIYPRR